jgi:signal transduction protein with GAF and PtsI domain
VNFVGDVFSYIARTGYHKKRLVEIAQEVVELDPLFSSYYEQKILDSLLSACSILLNADSGSVMTVDKSNRLHISASTRIDQDIVDKTNIRIGEGIAGMAASSSESIILPKDSGKAGVLKNMKRDQIRSSMIVPFSKANKNDVYGVLSLNILREDKEFTEKDIALTKELVNMASIALVSIG